MRDALALRRVVQRRRADDFGECTLARREVLASQETLDVLPPEILRGDRRVRSESEEAVVVLRDERREHLALARRERAVAHHGLREREEVPRGVRLVREQVAEIGLAVHLGRCVLEVLEEHGSGMYRRGRGDQRFLPGAGNLEHWNGTLDTLKLHTENHEKSNRKGKEKRSRVSRVSRVIRVQNSQPPRKEAYGVIRCDRCNRCPKIPARHAGTRHVRHRPRCAIIAFRAASRAA